MLLTLEAFSGRSPTDGGMQVLELLVTNSVHRVYIAGQAGSSTPEHTVTPADIMLALCKHTGSSSS